MENVFLRNNPKLDFNVNELGLSKITVPLRPNIKTNVKPKSFGTGVDGDFFNDEDAEMMDINDDEPEVNLFGNSREKAIKYKENYPKDDSLTDTNFDSTDTEPTDTDMVSTSESELSLYKTTTDESDHTFNPNTEAHDYSTPSYHSSEDDSEDSTDTEYFDSDATTESSERSYTSLSENVDDSPDPEPKSEVETPEFPPMKGGPPETFKWSSDEAMEIPVVNTGAKTIDPFEDMKKAAREKRGPDFVASAEPFRKRGNNENNSKFTVSAFVTSIARHIAPKNTLDLKPDLSEGMLTETGLQAPLSSSIYEDNSPLYIRRQLYK